MRLHSLAAILLVALSVSSAKAATIDSTSFCVTDTSFHFDVSVTGEGEELIFRIGADSSPFSSSNERIAVNFDSSTGEITRQEFVVENFGAAPDRWLDGPVTDAQITNVGGTSWRVTGSVAHGTERLLIGDSLNSLWVRADVNAAIGSLPVESCIQEPLEPIDLLVPSTLITPVIDGRLDWQEWQDAERLEIESGFIAFKHDSLRMYVLIDMLGDNGDDSFASGGGDNFWLQFDVDEDGIITPGVDRQYRLEAGTGNLRYQTYCPSCVGGFSPLEPSTFSARAEGFGCFLEDSSRGVSLRRCNSHRIWELAIDLSEVGLDDRSTRFGYRIESGIPSLSTNYPDSPADIANFAQLSLERSVLPGRSYPDLALPDLRFEVTQAIQTLDNDLDLVVGRKTAVRLWDASNASYPASFRGYIYGTKSGIDLPGSPLIRGGPITTNFSENVRDRNDFTTLPAPWLEPGQVNFEVVLKESREDTFVARASATIRFATTKTPVFWSVPVRSNLADGSSSLIDMAWITAAEQTLLQTMPIQDIHFVRRPVFDVTNIVSSEALKAELQAYDQQVVLAWTLGVLFTGESPYDLPEQVTGFFPNALGNTHGSSDPIWSDGGRGRINWVNPDIRGNHFGYIHELNHNLDFEPIDTATWGLHVAGCGGGSGDAAWPNPSVWIQDDGAWWTNFGIKSITGDATPDLMSYCISQELPLQWVSAYRWDKWLHLFRDDLPTLPPGFPVQLQAMSNAAPPVPEDSFYLLGKVFADGRGEFGQVLRQPGLPTNDSGAGDYGVELLDNQGSVLAAKYFTPSFVDVEGEPRDFVNLNMVLPASDAVRSIEITRNGEVLDSIAVSVNAPVIVLTSPNGGEVWDADVTITWQASDEDGDDLLFTLLFSADGGRTWLPLATQLPGNSYALDSTQLPGTDDARIRILATDGANTSQDDSNASFRVLDKPPQLEIISPVDNGRVGPDGSIELLGLARDPIGNRLPDDALRWHVNGQIVGAGAKVQVWLEAGTHEVSLLYIEDELVIAGDMVTIIVADIGSVVDTIDNLAGGIDIVVAGTQIEGDRFVCQIDVRSGADGLTPKGRYACNLDFNDLENEMATGCDANGDGILEGGFILGSNNKCETADITLEYTHKLKGANCKGPANVQCVLEEVSANGSTDNLCDGSVDGMVAEVCRVSISAPLAVIAAERDLQCVDADDTCLGSDGSSSQYQMYTYFTTRLKQQSDRAPDTGNNKTPNNVNEVLVIPMQR